MPGETVNDPAGRTTRHFAVRVAAGLSVLSVGVFVVLLGARLLATNDLGYHLAYGDHFLDTGRLVDTNPYIYTVRAEMPENERGEPGPGCWYDSDGRYRFPNANWLTQVVMAAAHRYSGIAGLCILRTILVAAVFVMVALAARRLNVPRIWVASGVFLAAMVANERFRLRPELFGYLVLAAQLFLLAGLWRTDARTKRRTILSLVILQLLLVNFHSYFLLGLALTGAMLADSLARLAWNRLRSGAPEEARRLARRNAGSLGIALATQSVICFVNPWTWRLVVLPVQTLLYMKKHHISGGQACGGHPWSSIGEFFDPFASRAFAGTQIGCAFFVLLCLAGLGVLSALLRRRWGWALIIAAMTGVSLSMRRNIAPAAVLITPPALAGIHEALRTGISKIPARLRVGLNVGAGVLLTLTAVGFSLAVVTNRFYTRDRRPIRFGVGIMKLAVPVDAAGWIERNKPAGTLWCDYNSSSNIYYFVRPHPDVPIVTNTWAYPPSVMSETLDLLRTRREFREAADRYSIEIVCLQIDLSSAPLARRLANDPSWTAVYLDAMNAIFLRADGSNARLARSCAVTPQTLDVKKHLAALKRQDPVAAVGVYLGGHTLYLIGWGEPAVEVFREAVSLDEDSHRAWNMLGVCLAERGTRRAANLDRRGRKDWQEARECFLRSLSIKPDSDEAKKNLSLVKRQIEAIRQRRILMPAGR